MSAASSSVQNAIPGMSRLVTVKDDGGPERGRMLCGELEAGNILYFPQTPFAFPDDDLKFLLGRKQTDASFHKNIAYRPAEDRITGLDKSAQTRKSIVYARSLRDIRSVRLNFWPNCCRHTPESGSSTSRATGRWKKQGRPARLRARNDLPHVDAFPTRPTNGDRILRSIHEHQSGAKSRVDHEPDTST